MLRFNSWSTARQIASSFILVILIGSILLSLPISQLPTSTAGYFQHLFTAVSMVCVTGLTLVDVSVTYSLFGQIINLILIQIGGLGLITIICYGMIQLGIKLPFSSRVVLSQAMNLSDVGQLRRIIAVVFRYTLFVEGIAAILLAIRFVPMLGFGKGVFTAIYLSISAFCNAGFDNLGSTSLQHFVNDHYVKFIIAALIILGGIGFSVVFDIRDQTRKAMKQFRRISVRYIWRKLSPHTVLVLKTSLALIVLGTLCFVILEHRNPETIAHQSWLEKFSTGFFETVTMRTAGFSTINYTLARHATIFIFILTMVIGGSPGGTAGGLKTTTFSLIIFAAWSEIRGKHTLSFRHRTIPERIFRQAVLLAIMFMFFLLGGTIVLSILNPDKPFIYLLFEATSALATVGVTADLTQNISAASHIVLMILMFIGRIGPLTMILTLTERPPQKEVVYAKTNILIG